MRLIDDDVLPELRESDVLEEEEEVGSDSPTLSTSLTADPELELTAKIRDI